MQRPLDRSTPRDEIPTLLAVCAWGALLLGGWLAATPRLALAEAAPAEAGSPFRTVPLEVVRPDDGPDSGTAGKLSDTPHLRSDTPGATGTTSPTSPHGLLGLAEQLLGGPVAELAAAADEVPDRLAAVESWNLGGGRPWRNALVRVLPAPLEVCFAPREVAAGAGHALGGVYTRPDPATLRWATEVRVAGAHRLRLRLSAVELPGEARLWVHGAGTPAGLGVNGAPGDAREFAPPVVDQGEAVSITPSVEGEVIRLEVELPVDRLAPTVGFVLDGVVEIVRLGPRGEVMAATSTPASSPLAKADSSCLVDAPCVEAITFPAVRAAERAVAQLEFVDGEFGQICTGALLADTDPTTIAPYLITAAHCFSTPEAAATVEATFDLVTDGCSGAPPLLASLPRVHGSTLLATDEATDFTLVRLDAEPAGERTYLGWTTAPVAAGTELHRLSHPVAGGALRPQSYTRYATVADQPCGGSATDLLNMAFVEGGSFEGSAGAPSMLADGTVVGVLSGACGPAPAEGCDRRNFEVDGAFAAVYPQLAPHLDAAPVAPVTPLTSDGFESGGLGTWSSVVQ